MLKKISRDYTPKCLCAHLPKKTVRIRKLMSTSYSGKHSRATNWFWKYMDQSSLKKMCLSTWRGGYQRRYLSQLLFLQLQNYFPKGRHEKRDESKSIPFSVTFTSVKFQQLLPTGFLPLPSFYSIECIHEKAAISKLYRQPSSYYNGDFVLSGNLVQVLSRRCTGLWRGTAEERLILLG